MASELVKNEPELNNIVDFLLGRVVIAQNLDLAVQMARKTSYSCRIVTLEGDVINPGGSMSGGFNRSTGSGVLGRAREITELEQQIEKLRVTLAEREKELPTIESTMLQFARQLSDLEKRAVDNSHLRVREESRLGSLQQEFEKNDSPPAGTAG